MARSADAAGVGRRLIRGSAQRTLAFLTGNLLAAGAAILLLRDLGVEDFGRYGAVIALLTIVQGVTDAGLSVTAMRDLALLEPERRRGLLAQVVGARLVLTSIGVLLAVAFSAVAGYGSTLVVGTLVAGVGVVLTSTQGALVLPLSVELRNGAIAVNELVRQAAVAATLVVLVLAAAPLGAFFLAHAVAGVVLLAIAPLLVGRAGLVLPRIDLAGMRVLLRAAAPVAVASVLSILHFRILVVLVSLLTDDRQTGLYVTASRIMELVSGLPLLLSVIAVPLLSVAARDDRAQLQLVLQRMTEVMAVAGVLLAVGLAVGARPVLVLLGGDEYVDAAPVLRLLAVALVTLFVGAAWTPTLVGLGSLRPLAVVSSIGLGVVVVLGLVLTSRFGIEGTAAAAVIADVVLVGGVLVALRRAGPGRELSLAFGGRLAVVAGLAVAVALVSGLPDALAAILAVVVLAASAIALKLVPAEVLAAVRG